MKQNPNGNHWIKTFGSFGTAEFKGTAILLSSFAMKISKEVLKTVVSKFKPSQKIRSIILFPMNFYQKYHMQ